jgi:hypothetical protein
MPTSGTPKCENANPLDALMMPAGAPPFDAAAKERAKRVAAAAGKPKTRDEGLKAIHAALHRQHFREERAAWEAYGSTRQRFYEWKPHCQLTTIDAMLQPAPASAATAPQPWRYRYLPDVPLELKTNGCLPAAFLCTAMREHLTYQSQKRHDFSESEPAIPTAINALGACIGSRIHAPLMGIRHDFACSHGVRARCCGMGRSVHCSCGLA